MDPETEVRDLASRLSSESMHLFPAEVAADLEGIDPSETASLLASGDRDTAALVFEHLDPQVAEQVLLSADPEMFRRIAGAVDVQDLARVLLRVDPDVRKEKVAALDPSMAAEVGDLMEHPQDTAGGIMDPRPVIFRESTPVSEALIRLRTTRESGFEDLFVIDERGMLKGRVPLEALVLEDPGTQMGRLARGGAVVQATSSVQEVLDLAERTQGGIPVIDHAGRLLGAITPDAMTSAAEEEASADIQMMMGASREERALSAPMFAIRRRLPWLYVNLVTAFVAASVVGLFEQTIAQITALAVLMPVVAGQSGNSGNQALAVTMRGLALREIRSSHWRRLALKEAAVGFVDGLAIAGVTSVGVYAWSRSGGLALVIGVSMIISMTCAGVAGASIPIVLKKLGQDPAQSSSVFLTTLTDIVGFLTFLGLAALLAARI